MVAGQEKERSIVVRYSWIVGLVLYLCVSAFAEITDDAVVALVQKTGADITADAAGTLSKVSAGEAPYKNPEDESFYVFVYDPDVTIVAHPDNNLVGRNYKGKPDVRGKKFRDDLVNVAIADGKGWVDYSYQKPGESGIHEKTTYAEKAVGNDGKTYIICCGKYK